MNLEQFKQYIKEHDDNVLNHDDSDLNEIFKNENGFILACKKCGSTNVEVIGEFGCDYGEMTGYCSGTTVFKCNNCGNAKTMNI